MLTNELTVVPALEEREQFAIDNQERAAWAMRKLVKVREKQADNTNTANSLSDGLRKEMERVDDWLKEVNGELDKSADYFISGLEMYYKNWLKDNPKTKTKTIKLPHGKLCSKQLQPEFQVDKVKLLAWMKQNKPELVKTETTTTESADWSELKKLCKVSKSNVVLGDDGLVVDGVTAIEREPKFEVVTE